VIRFGRGPCRHRHAGPSAASKASSLVGRGENSADHALGRPRGGGGLAGGTGGGGVGQAGWGWGVWCGAPTPGGGGGGVGGVSSPSVMSTACIAASRSDRGSVARAKTLSRPAARSPSRHESRRFFQPAAALSSYRRAREAAFYAATGRAARSCCTSGRALAGLSAHDFIARICVSRFAVGRVASASISFGLNRAGLSRLSRCRGREARLCSRTCPAVRGRGRAGAVPVRIRAALAARPDRGSQCAPRYP